MPSSTGQPRPPGRPGPEAVVYVGGVFDLFHVGHLNLLERAKALGKHLIVGVLTDAAAAAYKPRPIIPFEQRMKIIEALACVDAVVPQPNTNATPELERFDPDILVHGDDWTPGWEIGQTWIARHGKKFVLLPYTPGVSSTAIKQRIIDLRNARIPN